MYIETPAGDFPIRGIDTHAHIFTQQLTFVSAGEGYIPDYDATLETFLQKLHQHHLTHAVLIQPSFLGNDNSHLLAAVRSHPEELRAIVIAGPETEQGDLEAMRAQGAVGTRLILYGTKDEDYGSQRWREYARRIASLGWIVEIYGESSRLRSVCEPLLEANCRLLIDHYGRPNPETNIEDEGFIYLLGLAKTGRVWVDTSGPYRSAKGKLGLDLSKRYFSLLQQHFGLERLLWGSDWPCVRYEPWANYEHSVKFLEEVLPHHEQRDQLLRQTPSRLFGLSTSST